MPALPTEEDGTQRAKRKSWYRREPVTSIVLAGVLPACLIAISHLPAWGGSWQFGELHDFLEVAGGFAAVVVTGLMLSRDPEPRAIHLWCGCGLLMMGTLDLLHTYTVPGGGFVWLRSLANLSGGLMLAMIWVPEERIPRRVKRLAPPVAMVAAATMGAFVIFARAWLPESTDDGFVPAIVAVNAAGGLLFLAAAARLLYRVGAQDRDRATLCGCCLLFGVAALGLGFTRMWQIDWWLLHLYRAVAYVTLGLYFIREYRRTGTELAESMAQLEAERRRFRDVLDILPAYVILLTPDYHVPFSNRFFTERFGDSGGRRCYEYLFGRETPCEICETYKVLKTMAPGRWKWTGPDQRDYDIFDFPFVDSDGSTVILEMGLDITEQQRAEEALRTSEQRYRSLVTATAQVVWTTNAAGEVEDMPAWRELTGQSREEVKGWGWTKAIHPEDAEGVEKAWAEAVRERRFYDTEYRLRRRTGGYLHVAARGVPVLNADGTIREWVGICTDITERKQAETELRRLNRALRTISLGTEAVARANDEQELLRTVCDIVVQEGGYPLAWVGYAEDDVDRTVRPVAVAGRGAEYVRNARITWADTERGRGPTGTAIRSGVPCYIPETTLDPRFGPWRQAALQHGYASAIAIPLLESGRGFGALNIYAPEPHAFEREEYALMTELAMTLAHGILALRAGRERDRAAAKLQELNTTLEQRVAQRTAALAATTEQMESFTYSVSHDLRAPLRHIDGFSKVLLEEHSGQLNELGRHYLERVREGTQRMGQLVDDLLNLSRLGRRELQLRPVPLARMAQEVIDELESEAAGRRVEWHVGGLPLAQCDPGLMRQVLLNLLSNALKFTRGRDPAVIEIGSEGAELYVRDNGVGFDPQYAGKLFGVFQRLHRSEDFPGTGVGLATVRRILRKHGGDIRAEAKPGAGATFYFTLGTPEPACAGPEMEESHAA